MMNHQHRFVASSRVRRVRTRIEIGPRSQFVGLHGQCVCLVQMSQRFARSEGCDQHVDDGDEENEYHWRVVHHVSFATILNKIDVESSQGDEEYAHNDLWPDDEVNWWWLILYWKDLLEKRLKWQSRRLWLESIGGAKSSTKHLQTQTVRTSQNGTESIGFTFQLRRIGAHQSKIHNALCDSFPCGVHVHVHDGRRWRGKSLLAKVAGNSCRSSVHGQLFHGVQLLARVIQVAGYFFVSLCKQTSNG